jgi:hypothetical protein
MVYYFLMNAQSFLSLFVAWAPQVCVTHNAVHGRKSNDNEEVFLAMPIPKRLMEFNSRALRIFVQLYGQKVRYSLSSCQLTNTHIHQHKWVDSANTKFIVNYALAHCTSITSSQQSHVLLRVSYVWWFNKTQVSQGLLILRHFHENGEIQLQVTDWPPSLRNNRFEFKSLGKSPIILEESIEYTSN